MALFFDAAWFDERLARLGLSHATLATALGLPDSAVNEIWKDQRELSAREVGIIAALLGASGEEVAVHAGVSTPVPGAALDSRPPSDIADRLQRIENALAELTALVRKIALR
jgi:cyanate lyase